jgi:Rrf2 family protein
VHNVLRISDAASLAMHTMVLLASTPEDVVSTGEIAEVLRASEAHLSKILQRLSKAGLVKSTRGPSGGFKLAKEPEEICLLEVYEAMDGPLPESACLLDTPICVGPDCVLGGILKGIGDELKKYLGKTSLDGLIGTLCITREGDGFDD